MKAEQKKWTKKGGWINFLDNNLKDKAQLVLAFGGTEVVKDKKRFQEIKSFYPKSNIIMCSTAGEILGTDVSDDSISLTAIYFEKTKLNLAEINNKDPKKSKESGKALMKLIPTKDLTHVMVFSDGLKINGSDLVESMQENLPEGVAITGGLVGDGARFKQTLAGLNKVPEEGKIIIIGFYGKNIKIGYGSLGGWDPFGPNRLITKSKDNVLYELDEKPALKLYKEYLGSLAKGLPGTGLLFPLNLHLKTDKEEVEVVRTILSVNEKEQSMTFAGNMPEGAYVELMKANLDRLVEGASGAAKRSKELNKIQPDLAILISCVGRKLVLKDRVEEEVEAVKKVLGEKTILTGFYSYGEISPAKPIESKCSLHNQTMTITAFWE